MTVYFKFYLNVLNKINLPKKQNFLVQRKARGCLYYHHPQVPGSSRALGRRFQKRVSPKPQHPGLRVLRVSGGRPLLAARR